ncbi:MAG: 2-amino-4-hydroxy-6-hydroxymethyldihydropteridine diphosphokinase [Muribaculaceae bacterium]|nr:2-amino-4-hydroxy-6-hydroxymethyldihydropteridine diphosphokinase [Muribaculaceae bacterium]
METTGIRVVMSLGSNSGDRGGNIRDAIRWLHSVMTEIISSEIYETPPVGHSKGNYMNAVVIGKIQEDVSSLEKRCKEYEIANGRDAKARSEGKVPIDIDIVVIGGRIVREKDYNSNFFKIGFSELIK